MLYRLVGALGASAAVTGYLYFVYNPGMGDRRYQRQRQENDSYFDQNEDNYQDGDWDNNYIDERDGRDGIVSRKQ